MANLGNKRESFYWLLIDASHASWRGTVVSEAKTRHKSKVSAELAVLEKPDGTRALIKVVSGDRAWTNARSWKGAVLRVFDEADHDEAKDMIRKDGWYP